MLSRSHGSHRPRGPRRAPPPRPPRRLWTIPFTGFQGSIYVFTHKAPAHAMMALALVGAAAAYMGGAVAGGGRAASDRSGAVAASLLSTVHAAFLFQALFVVKALIPEELQVPSRLAQSLALRNAPNARAIQPLFELYRERLGKVEGALFIVGIITGFLGALNAFFVQRDTRETQALHLALAESQAARKKDDDAPGGSGGAAAGAGGGAAAAGGAAGDAAAEGPAGGDDADPDAPPAPEDGRKPSKYRRKARRD